MKQKNKLLAAWDEYNKVVDAYAVERFESVVKPWLIRHDYNFLAGNGTWYVFDKNGDAVDPDYGAIPIRVLVALETEVPGLPANDLGSLMPDFRQNGGGL